MTGLMRGELRIDGKFHRITGETWLIGSRPNQKVAIGKAIRSDGTSGK